MKIDYVTDQSLDMEVIPVKAVAVSGNSADRDNERCSDIRLLDRKQDQREHRGRCDPRTPEMSTSLVF